MLIKLTLIIPEFDQTEFDWPDCEKKEFNQTENIKPVIDQTE